MAVIGLTSAKGSPGVTTAALALGWVWPAVHPGRRVLVVDADPAGTGTSAGFLRGTVPEGAGVVEWAAGLTAASRTGIGGAGPDARRGLWDHLVTLDEDGRRLLLPGVGDPGQARALAGGWEVLARVLTEVGTGEVGPFPDRLDVLVDLGRAGGTADQRALWRGCAVLAVLTRSTLAQVSAAAGLVHRLQDSHVGARVAVVLVGQNTPYRAGEIAAALKVPVTGVLAVDRAAAAVFSDGTGRPRGFESSALVRSARALAASLGAQASPTAPPPAGGNDASPAGPAATRPGTGMHPRAEGVRSTVAQAGEDTWGGRRG
ncbi:MAG: hypothetical protein GXX79_20440 [Actinomycetales bacterium]|nr:hypothetical protein [Actinomycetales bacterium]